MAKEEDKVEELKEKAKKEPKFKTKAEYYEAQKKKLNLK